MARPTHTVFVLDMRTGARWTEEMPTLECPEVAAEIIHHGHPHGPDNRGRCPGYFPLVAVKRGGITYGKTDG